MVRPDFDVIVAGAGPAGATAAHDLGQAGLSVLVVEKSRLPRYKACGGAIPRAALAALPFDLDAAIRAAPGRVRLTFPGQQDVMVALPEQPVAMVQRSEFDALLLDQSGADVLQGRAVTKVVEGPDSVRVEVGGHGTSVQAGTDKAFTARYLVGADGAASTVARGLRLRSRRKLGGSLEADLPLNGNSDLRARFAGEALFALGAIDWGYGWVFPKGDTISVGIARFRPGRANLHAALHKAMEELGIPTGGVELHGHPIPYYQAPPWPFWQGLPQERISTRRCLLVGDAAGLVDPLLGEGIRYAIASANLAAAAIVRGDLSGYEAAIWNEIGHSLATAGLAARVYYHAPKLGYRVGLRNPATAHGFVDQFAGRTTYQGIGRRLFASAAGWMLAGGGRWAKHQDTGDGGRNTSGG